MFCGKIDKNIRFSGDFMFEKRTDLALEVHELHGDASGIEVNEQIKDGIKVTVAEVSQGIGEKSSGKKAGRYITLDIGKIWKQDKKRFRDTAALLASEIESLLPQVEGTVLVAGLGNEEITSDSIGPLAVKRLLVTRHIAAIDSLLFKSAGFGSLAAISPGVLGQTGIESAEIIKSICDTVKPKCVIVIDSLASRRLSRLATTVQLSDNGISPGSGVSNRRVALDSELLGTKVVSIGVPTVVDAATLAYDLLEEHTGREDDSFSRVINNLMEGSGRNMFVTPKDNDIIAKQTASLIAIALNLAVHKLSIDEINEYLGSQS